MDGVVAGDTGTPLLAQLDPRDSTPSGQSLVGAYPHRRSDGGTERKRCLSRHPPPNNKLATLTPANSAIFIRADSRVYGSSIRNFGSRNSHIPPSASSPSREPSRA